MTRLDLALEELCAALRGGAPYRAALHAVADKRDVSRHELRDAHGRVRARALTIDGAAGQPCHHFFGDTP